MTDRKPIAERTIGDYLAALGSPQPAPGGGSVAGVVGALAAGLGQMVVSLSLKGEHGAALEPQFVVLESARESLLAAAAADERAYSAYVEARKLPKATDEEMTKRRDAMQAALVNAATVPLMLAESACNMLDDLAPVVREGTSHALSDAELAVVLAHTSVTAGLVNVRVNLPLIKDEAKARSLSNRAISVEQKAGRLASELRATLAVRRAG